MFEKKYDKVVCKNVMELIYVDSVAEEKLDKNPLGVNFHLNASYPVNLLLFGDNVGWSDSKNRIGREFSFQEFVEWEQNMKLIAGYCSDCYEPVYHVEGKPEEFEHQCEHGKGNL